MKRLILSALALSTLSTGILLAQSKTTKPVSAKTPAKPKYKPAPVFLGNSDQHGGLIAKSVFDSLVRQGLTAKDSAGNPITVTEFRIYYKERNLYEDSAGKYYTDYEILTDFAKGNKLNSYVAIQDRTKSGDTAIFDDILVMHPDSAVVQGIGMKFVIGK
ncbi:MAG TPA: hypothetical protein VL092_03965 [Chitinophagaceae bacterium]|nr:hypothetical protein [Chitinophagaceae bacterium]